MRSLIATASIALVALVAAPALAQTPPPDSITQVFRQKAMTGMTDKYEAGRKKHMAWHKAQGDTWAWNTFEIMTGPDTGAYIIASGEHQWADFDTWTAKYGEGDTADALVSMAGTQAGSQMTFWTQLGAVSRMPPPGEMTPFLTLTTYTIKPGSDSALLATIAKLNAVLEAEKFPVRSVWYRLSSGGGPSYAVVSPRANMAAMAPKPSLMEAVEKQLGKAESDALVKAFFENVTGLSTEMLQRRPDLSYSPK